MGSLILIISVVVIADYLPCITTHAHLTQQQHGILIRQKCILYDKILITNLAWPIRSLYNRRAWSAYYTLRIFGDNKCDPA